MTVVGVMVDLKLYLLLAIDSPICLPPTTITNLQVVLGWTDLKLAMV